VFPVKDAAVKARIHDEILPAYLADTVKARLQQPDGTYRRATVPKDGFAFSAQDFLMMLAEGKAELSAIPEPNVLVAASPRKRPGRKAPEPAHAAD